MKPPVKKRLKLILDSLHGRKAEDVRVLDVRKQVSYADLLVICGGNSTTHVQALVAAVKESLAGVEKPAHVNSSPDDSWWVIDYVDLVVHIFRKDVRPVYDLEGLWSDAVDLDNGLKKAPRKKDFGKLR